MVDFSDVLIKFMKMLIYLKKTNHHYRCIKKVPLFSLIIEGDNCYCVSEFIEQSKKDVQ